MESAKPGPTLEHKQVRLVYMFFLSNKFSFPLFTFIISQNRKRESSTSTTAPNKRAKKDIPKEVKSSDDSVDGMVFPHRAPAK